MEDTLTSIVQKKITSTALYTLNCISGFLFMMGGDGSYTAFIMVT